MLNKVMVFHKALSWIKANTIDTKGITVTSKQRMLYPEVTGYYIPTLLEWGERDLAKAYAQYLCDIQKEDGSWYDCGNNAPYVFDSSQILKGLLAIREIMPEVKYHIIKGCNWILSNVCEDGRLTTPSKGAWGDDESFCSELVHLYCITPLLEASEIYGYIDFKAAAYKIVNYYKENYRERIVNFSLFSHFYAYVLEGLIDLGEIELVQSAMKNLEKYQNIDGSIPGLKDVTWVCSTGMFQLALVWYKLGELEKGNKLFYHACSFQNESGGWFGSYPISYDYETQDGRQKPFYFPEEEISWANKYFLDALAYKEKLEFEKMSDIFLEDISPEDGRFLLVKDQVLGKGKVKILDAGCGKGRYIKRLLENATEEEFFALDLSENVMRNLPCNITKKQGKLTNIPYDDNYFDYVYACESYEHAINLEGAFKEIYRVLKLGGSMIIIDKPLEKLGKLSLYEWEQWIDDGDMEKYTEECGGTLEIVKSVAYEEKEDGLFRAWLIKK